MGALAGDWPGAGVLDAGLTFKGFIMCKHNQVKTLLLSQAEQALMFPPSEPRIIIKAGKARYEINNTLDSIKRLIAGFKRKNHSIAMRRDSGKPATLTRASESDAACVHGKATPNELKQAIIQQKTALIVRMNEALNGRGAFDTWDRIKEANRLELKQRELVRRGLLDATDLDKTLYVDSIEA